MLNMMKLIALYVAICCYFQFTYGLQFTSLESTIWANISTVARFEFQYSLDANDNTQILVTVECSYTVIVNGAIVATKLFKKSGASFSEKLNSGVGSRTNPFVDPLNDKKFGFEIKDVRTNDPKTYQCLASYVSGGAATSEPSRKVTLQVLEPPNFSNCLKKIVPAKFDSTLGIACEVTGNPIPIVQCRLLRSDDTIIMQYPRQGFQPLNITYGFQGANLKYARKVMCIADGGRTGKYNISVDLTIYHAPFAIRNFSQYVPTNHIANTIYLKWLPIPSNETGGNFQGYKLDYWVKGQNEMLTKITRNLGFLRPSNLDHPGYITYLFEDANATLQYNMRVYGFNDIDSDVRNKEIGGENFVVSVMRPPTSGESSSDKTGLIVGVVIGSIVVLVIIIVLVVWCYQRSDKDKRFPTSYVEDAVDYPPNQTPSLYANVDKKPKTTSRRDSTSGYPDVVTSNNEYYMPTKSSSSSFEPSSKAFV